MAVLTNAVTQRWSDDADLANALERAAVARRDRIGSVSRGGVDALDEVLNELLTFVRTVDSTLRRRKRCPTIRQAKKQRRSSPWRFGGPATTAEGVLLLERVGSNPAAVTLHG